MGERLGRYVVLGHLASGGMADVLLARTDGIEGFERHVVLKRIRAEHAKDRRFIDMFLDEARLAANLHHQNIVQVHDIGESDGEYFFAMEYIHGEDLRSLLSAVAKTRTHMPLGYVVAIISAAAAGLHYAHERRSADKKPLNIVHRDVSPSNILLGYDGAVKVVDFGIAKAAMRQVETRSGSLKGKVSYMSPEQCKMADVDRRSDVYALGVVLYELATMTRLFKSDSDYLVMDAICTGKVPLPRVRRPDLPNDLSTIIMQALATDAERRYQTAEELRSALDTFAIKHGLTANAGALATYIHKLFGEKPEPWLDIAASGAPALSNADTTGTGTDMARRSWTEIPRGEHDDGTTTTDGKATTSTDGKGARRAAAPPAIDVASHAERTSTRLAWERQPSALPPAPARGRRTILKAAIIAVPLLAIAGIGAWRFLGSGSSTATRDVAAASAPMLPSAGSTTDVPPPPAIAAVTPAPAVAPPVATTKAAPRVGPAVVDPAVALATTPAVAQAAQPDARETLAARARSTTSGANVSLTKAKPASTKPSARAATSSKPTRTATSAKLETVRPAVGAKPVAPPSVPAPLVTSPAARPVVVEPPMAVLSAVAIEQVASYNRRQLATCEGMEDLSGEVTVRFEVDAAGRVVKSQMSTTMKNRKVAGCILRSLRSWKFPRPASGAAKGVYTIAYQ